MGDTPPSPERRRFLAGLSSAAGALFLARPSVRGAREGEMLLPGAFRFLVVNDLHHAEPACDPFFEQLVAHMRRHAGVEFCLVLGDLADSGRPESLAAIRRIFSGLDMPVYPVPGNHDNDVTGDTRAYAAVFPDHLNYHFVHRGWQFIGLDSTEGTQWGDTQISTSTLAYLDGIVPGLHPLAPTVVFTHFPLAENIRMRPVNAAEVLERLAPLHLRAAFCGHFHSRTEKPHGTGLLTTNVCCSRVRANHDGTQAEGYLVCTAQADGKLLQEFVEFEPASARPEAPPNRDG